MVRDPGPYHEVTGVIHCHSTYSDGFEPVPIVVKAANEAGLDYLLMTDHNTLAYLEEVGEGWQRETLLLLGIEVSPPRSHYLAYGIQTAPCEQQPLQGIIDDVKRQGGVGFVAHPFDRGSPFLRVPSYHWEDWTVTGFDGLELWNWISDWAGNCTGLGRALRSVVDWRFAASGPDQRALELWDALGRTRRVVGIGGVDAHGIKKRILGVDMRIHPYAKSFRTVRTHLLLREPFVRDPAVDRLLVLEALREGRCYFANWLQGDPTGFAFTASQSGEVGLTMGEEAVWSAPTQLSIRTPSPATIRLLCDGRPIAERHGAHLEADAAGPGVYRTEVWRQAKGWIFSNPIYLRG